MVDLSSEIEENDKGPKRVKGDSGEIEQHPIKDQILADRYFQSKKATQKAGLGAKRSKLIVPGGP